MERAHGRKKQPEIVRRRLLDAAARIAVEDGVGNLTIQAVADAAGVTKGGLLHHFHSKEALIDAVFSDLLEKLDRQIDRALARDRQAHGRFSRAYLAAAFEQAGTAEHSIWAALSVSILTQPSLRGLWAAWLARRLAQHQETDGAPSLEIVRYAADGVWLADLIEAPVAPVTGRDALFARLVALTHGEETR